MQKFENIIILSDLDGTLLDSQEKVSETNKNAIEYFKANGGRFAIATGRGAQHVVGAIPNIKDLVNFLCVTCNGVCLYDFLTGQTPVVKQLSYEETCDIVTYVKEKYKDSGIRASSPDYCFVITPEDSENKYISEELEKYKGQRNLIAPLENWKNETILKVVIRLDEEIVVRALYDLQLKFKDKFSVTQSGNTIIDVQLHGVNKGSTIMKYIRETFGGDVTVYACGDYVNDLELLKAADISVCPSGAHESVKELSDLCLCSNDEGLIDCLVKFIEKNN